MHKGEKSPIINAETLPCVVADGAGTGELKSEKIEKQERKGFRDFLNAGWNWNESCNQSVPVIKFRYDRESVYF